MVRYVDRIILAQELGSAVAGMQVRQLGDDDLVGDGALLRIRGYQLFAVTVVLNKIAHAPESGDAVQPVVVVHEEIEQVPDVFQHIRRRIDDALVVLVLGIRGRDYLHHGGIGIGSVDELHVQLFRCGILEQHLIIGGIHERPGQTRSLELQAHEVQREVDQPVLLDRI